MSACTLFASGFAYLVDADGHPVVGGKIVVHRAGLITPAVVYTDPGLSIPWTQPIVTNAAGQSDGPIYVSPTPALDIYASDANDAQLPGFPVLSWSPLQVAT